MKVCSHHGLIIAVLTRNEHCPPHVHVGTDRWEARFEFSFWHNGVRLWDVVPLQHQPNAAQMEELRQIIKLPKNLLRAREIWWASMQSMCLVNQWWDLTANEVVSSPRHKLVNAFRIESAVFDLHGNKTVLKLAGQTSPLEILL